MNQPINTFDAVLTPVVYADGGDVFATSRDVAIFFAKEHRHVLRDVDHLIQQEPSLGQGGMPSFELTPHIDPQNGQTYRMYRMTRKGFTLLAMGFTGEKALRFKLRYIDAFEAMEAELRKQAAPQVPQTFADALRLAAAQAEENARLAERVEKAEIAAETFRVSDVALQRIAVADGSMCITDAAKALQMRPTELFRWLRQNGWIYRRAGSAHDLGYQSKTVDGLLEHKITTVLRADGSEKVTEQVRVTSKGITKLAKLIPPVALTQDIGQR